MGKEPTQQHQHRNETRQGGQSDSKVSSVSLYSLVNLFTVYGSLKCAFRQPIRLIFRRKVRALVEQPRQVVTMQPQAVVPAVSPNLQNQTVTNCLN
eukprot:SAG31_NODE_32747_length_352_cov_0.612648_1_plen_95_part_01